MKKVTGVFIVLLLVLLGTGIAAAADDTLGSIVQWNTDVVIPEGHTVNGDVITIFGDIEVLGTVNGNCIAVLGNVEVRGSGQVRGDSVAVLGSMGAIPGSVQGNQVSVAAADFQNINLPNWNWQISRPHLLGFHYGGKVIALLFQLLITFLLVYFLPLPIQRIQANIRKNFFAAGGIGFLTVFASIAMMIFFAITIIGIPLSLLLTVLFAIVCFVAKYMGGAAIGLWIGQSVFKGSQSPVVSAIIGTLLVGVLLMIPFTGLIGLIVGLVSLGGVIATWFGTKGESICVN